MKRLLVIILTSVLFSFSCWHPPFDEDVALTAAATQKMTRAFEVRFSSFSENGKLLPVPSSQIVGGFVLINDPEEVTLKFLTRSFSSNEERSGVPLPVFEGMDPYYSQIFGAFTSAPRLVQFFPGGTDPDSTWDNDVLVLGYSVSTRVFEFSGTFDFLADAAYPLYFAGLSPAPALIDLRLSGFHMYPAENMNTVICHALIYRISENSIYELKFSLDASGAVAFLENINWERSGGLLEKLAVPEAYPIPEKAAYFYSPVSGMSYINVQENGGYRTERWSAVEPPEEIEVTEKVLAVLTTGEILTARSGYGRVYSPLGKEKFRVPLGDLVFDYETYKDGKAVVVFSYKHTIDGSTVYSVYTHPAADLPGLQ